MRIESLRMKNFAPLFVALDRTEVFLDYRGMENKMINIFIGQMGSCKTFLLGHHQPFATLGNLDVRNNEDMVLEGKKGIKEIVYSRGKDQFEILHIYTQSKGGSGHTTKSYIKKNGNELNENGNSSTFKEIVFTEFGMDQSFLKLFRIGSNVINLPDMSSTERKTFISSMIADTDIYTLLYRKIGEENRAINAQMTVLINKLHAISSKGEDELSKELETEQAIVEYIAKETDAMKARTYQIQASIDVLMNHRTIEQYHQDYESMKLRYTENERQREELESDLKEMEKYPDIQSLQKELNQLHTDMGVRNALILNLQMSIEEEDKKRKKLTDQLAIMGTPSHVENLKQTYQTLMNTISDYERQLRNFTYPGSMGNITALISDVQSVNSSILDVSQYNGEAIEAILKNPKGALNRAKRELDRLYRERDRLQQDISNMSAVSSYQPTHPLYRPFNCPTEDCPYYKYHPLTEKRNMPDNIDKSYLEKRNKKSKVEASIYLYEEYPNIARKLESVRSLWSRVISELTPIGCLKEEILSEIIINPLHRNWFDMDRLNRIKELCGIREKYYSLMQEVAAMRNDLTQFQLTDITTLQHELDSITAQFQNDCKELENFEDLNKKDKNRLTELTNIHQKMAQLTEIRHHYEELEKESTTIHSSILEMEANLEKVKLLSSELAEVERGLVEEKVEYSTHARAVEKLQLSLTDMRLTKDQYQNTLEKQALIHDVLDAVSSKKGIPLAYVRVFLADCKDIINDLISDVFDDDIEIVDFDIPEDSNEFKIPYTRNGALIDDIIKSSQGERAIISLALSFALIRQRTFPYNIMLLDEVDGPLHRSARNKFITILFKQLRAINAEQVFLVSHNNTFDGYNVNVIMTTNELVDENPLTSIMKL